jgi:predicted dienelactone hydrolase
MLDWRAERGVAVNGSRQSGTGSGQVDSNDRGSSLTLRRGRFVIPHKNSGQPTGALPATLATLVLLGLPLGAQAQTAATGLARRIPPPTGPLAVGRVELQWTDSSRTEPFVPARSARRELVVYIWYPADVSRGARFADYIPHIATIAAAIGDSALNEELGSGRSAVMSGAVRSHSVDDAPVRAAGRPFPVLVFSPGFGESSLTYSAQLEDLASHGYVVVGIEHPFDTYAVRLSPDRVAPFAAAPWDSARAKPNGAVGYQLAQVPLRADDVRFVIGHLTRSGLRSGKARFAGALDLHRIGAFGHSLGGFAAASACRFDARIRACMNEDADDSGRPFDGGPVSLPIKQPFLFFATGHSIYVSPRTPAPTADGLTRMKLTRTQYDSVTESYQHNQNAAFASLPAPSIRLMAEAEDFTHRSFLDLKALQAADSTAILHQQRYLQLIRQYVRAFFDETLRGRTAPALEREGEVDSLVTIQHFGPRAEK